MGKISKPVIMIISIVIGIIAYIIMIRLIMPNRRRLLQGYMNPIDLGAIIYFFIPIFSISIGAFSYMRIYCATYDECTIESPSSENKGTTNTVEGMRNRYIDEGKHMYREAVRNINSIVYGGQNRLNDITHRIRKKINL